MTSPIEQAHSNRTVMLGTDINVEKVGAVIKELVGFQNQSSEPINLVINSNGGRFEAAIRLCDFMTHVMTVPIHGWVWGQCSSAATFVLLFCEQRYCTPASYFMIHNPHVSVEKCGVKELKQLLVETEALQERMVKIYQDRLHLSRKKVIQLMERGDQKFDRYLTAEKAKEIGMVTEIVTGKIPLLTVPSQNN